MIKNFKKTAALLFIMFLIIGQKAHSQDYRYGKVSKTEVQQKKHPTYPEANAAILYREHKTDFRYIANEGFYIETDVYERIKVYTKEGFDWATNYVKLYQGKGGDNEKISGLKGITYYMEGSKIEEEKLRNDGIFEEETSEFLKKKKFTMPNLKEGCVIEFMYKKVSPFIQDIEEYRFQEKIPVDMVDIKITIPEYFNYKTHQKGSQLFKLEQTKGEGRIAFGSFSRSDDGIYTPVNSSFKEQKFSFVENGYKVVLKDVPPLKEESYVSNIENYASSLKFELSYVKYPNERLKTYATTWDAVVRSIYEATAFGGQLEKNNYFNDDLDVLLQGVTDDAEKMLRIFEYVKNKLTWDGYLGVYSKEGVKNAYRDGKGNAADINLMLVSMLQYAGLNANPVLVSTKANGIPLFPTRNGFNFVIAAVEFNSGVYLMDATDKIGEPNTLEPELLNWKGRIIRKNGSSSWISLMPSKQAKGNTIITAKIDIDGTVSGAVQNRYTGHLAQSYRKNYNNKTDEDKRKNIEKSLKDTELANIEFQNLRELYKPVNLKYDFESFNFIENISGKLYLSPLLFVTINENPFKLESRQYPVDFEYPKTERYIINIELPQGYTVESKPENSSFALPEEKGSFLYSINVKGNVLQISMEHSIKDAMITSQFYPNLKKFYELLIEKQNEKIVLIKA